MLELLYQIFQARFEIVFLVSNAELMFLETSALTGENVEEAFVQCARKILNKIESGKQKLILYYFNTFFPRNLKYGFKFQQLW